MLSKFFKVLNGDIMYTTSTTTKVTGEAILETVEYIFAFLEHSTLISLEIPQLFGKVFDGFNFSIQSFVSFIV